MSQWPNSTGAHRISSNSIQHIAGDCENKRGEQESEKDLHAVGSFHPAEDRGALTHPSTPPDRNDKGDQESQRVLEEPDKERDVFDSIWGNETMKKPLTVALSKRSKLALFSRSVSLSTAREHSG
jgi:hypothetical protein